MPEKIQLTEEEYKRYDRHLRLANFGLEKQLKLKESKILLVGAGGLGCPIALYLAASGVGNISIVDGDNVELSNLQRQIAFSVDDIGKPKATALANKVLKLNPLLNISHYTKRIDASNVEELIFDHDLVIDGTDNFATRFLLADASFLNRIPYLHASVHQYQGQISLFIPGKTACFRCLYRQAPNSSALPPCTEVGVLGAITGTIGLIASTEAIKYLAELGETIAGKVLIYDAIKQESRKIVLEYDENCPLCSKNATITEIEKKNNLDGNPHASCLARMAMEDQIIAVTDAQEMIRQDIVGEELLLFDVREPHEYDQGHIPGAVSLPLSVLKSASIETVTAQLQTEKTKEQKILCYCQKGGRSLQATNLLREAGFGNTYSMDGGIEAWQMLTH